MKSLLKTIAGFTATVLFAGALMMSCNKKPETIGLDLVDANKPDVGYDTTIPVRVWSSLDDSIPTDETSLNLLGSMTTENFGRVSPSFYTHLRLRSVNPDWGENPVADSVIFTMVYSNYYGNISTPQTIRIYEILESIKREDTLYSNQILETNANVELANFNFVPNPEDSVVVISGDDTSKVAAELRIPMSTLFAEKIFQVPEDSLSSSDAFINVFKGIHVIADDISTHGQGSILYFDLLNERSKVTIYYKNDSINNLDSVYSLSYELTINSNNARFGNFAHDYSLSTNPAFINQVINGDTTLGSEDLFLQCLSGVKTTIFFPDLEEWSANESRVINLAKLVFPIHENDDGYSVSTQLLLFQNQKDGPFITLRDYAQGASYFDGKLNDGMQTYSFRISLYIQDLISGEPDNGLVLFPNAKAVKATEIHLYGSNPLNSRKVQLQITFTDPN